MQPELEKQVLRVQESLVLQVKQVLLALRDRTEALLQLQGLRVLLVLGEIEGIREKIIFLYDLQED